MMRRVHRMLALLTLLLCTMKVLLHIRWWPIGSLQQVTMWRRMAPLPSTLPTR